MHRFDRALLLDVSARLDWRSVQALSCTQCSFCVAARDKDVQKRSQVRGADENWRNGRWVERRLPYTLKHADGLHAACVADVPVLAATMGGGRRRHADGHVALFDCRTQARLARLVDVVGCSHCDPFETQDRVDSVSSMVSDGRRALILRHHAHGGHVGVSCGVHLYDPQWLAENREEAAPYLPALFRICPSEPTAHTMKTMATRALDRILVSYLDRRSGQRWWGSTLVSHDVATGGRAAGLILNEFDVHRVCEHEDDGHFLALGNPKTAACRSNSWLVKSDARTPGSFRAAAFSHTRAAAFSHTRARFQTRSALCSCRVQRTVASTIG
ncbi:Hypothetical protein UVM_LOCUS124 [uncultured virus]|nr:Hypothetical protein UVM_LOCUS124 [uncultured virus]